uniref:HD domain-containing protein n=1 Tax=Ammonifex degensii TaxID=42838 RepID=A0A7C1F360_9THEO
MLAHIRRSLKTGVKEVAQCEFPVRDGRREYEARFVPVAENEVMAIVRDVSEQERLQSQLAEKEHFLASIFDSIQDGISVLDLDYNIVRVNKAIEQWYTHSVPLVGKKCYTAYHGRDKPCDAWVCPTRQALTTGGLAYAVVPLTGPEGEVRGWFDLYVFPWLGISTGEVRGVIEYVRDATRRLQAERELQASLERYERLVLDTVHAFGELIELRDPYTAGHQRRVAALATAIAEELNFAPEEVRGIQVAGLLHDIGKISVPIEILNKPARLTPLEMDLVKIHPTVGHNVLKDIEFPWPVAEIVYQHHERLDGSGYPQGLQEEEILPAARVLSVADVVEAMASHRPYQPARGVADALEEIRSHGGTRYDREVVAVCIRLFTKGRFSFT